MLLDFNFDFNIEKMNLEQLQVFTQNLLNLARRDAELIKTMKELIDKLLPQLELPQGE